MRTGEVCSIRALENGVVVSCRDPAIVKKNQTSKGSWQDPNKEYTFTSFKKALKWLAENESDLLQGDADSEYKDGFAAAIKET